MKRKFKF